MQSTSRSQQQSTISGASRTDALRCALSWPVAKRSLLVMVIIGSVLNLINQGDLLLSSGPINWWKVILTYCVPFCVATFGAYCGICASKAKGNHIN